VPAGKKGNQKFIHDPLLADDYLMEFGGDSAMEFPQLVDLLQMVGDSEFRRSWGHEILHAGGSERQAFP
jgi:hypothetical protein